MIRPILRYGDQMLHDAAAPVTEITPDMQRLIDDMIQTMYAAPGIGLAATQVGVPLRIFVADVSGGTPVGRSSGVHQPGARGGRRHAARRRGMPERAWIHRNGARPTRAVVKGLDRDGHEQVVEGTGLLARCFIHEMDHLDGTLFVDRLHGLKKDLIVRKIKKLSRSGKW